MAKNFPLRIIDVKLYDKLMKAAKENHQSVNGYINTVLEESVKKEKKHLVVSK